MKKNEKTGNRLSVIGNQVISIKDRGSRIKFLSACSVTPLPRHLKVAALTALLLCLTFSLSHFLTFPACAEVPHLVNYQGRLTDASGAPLTGTYSITFTIYDSESGGAASWNESDCEAKGGYWAATQLPVPDDYGCWFKSSSCLESCSATCINNGLKCSSLLWNDSSSCAICHHWYGGTSCQDWAPVACGWLPWAHPTDYKCVRLTTPGTHDCDFVNSNCPGSQTLTRYFCVCEPQAGGGGGGAALWTETQSVSVDNGIFNVLLGSDIEIPTAVFEDEERYLGIKVGDNLEMTPRQQIVSVGYAFRADKANDAQTVEGKTPQDLVPLYEWDGTSLRFVNPVDGTPGLYVDLEGDKGDKGDKGDMGDKGDKGDKGDMGDKGDKGDIGLTGSQGPQGATGLTPAHEWDGTSLRFQNSDGTWGPYVNLNLPEEPEPEWNQSACEAKGGFWGPLNDGTTDSGCWFESIQLQTGDDSCDTTCAGVDLICRTANPNWNQTTTEYSACTHYCPTCSPADTCSGTSLGCWYPGMHKSGKCLLMTGTRPSGRGKCAQDQGYIGTTQHYQLCVCEPPCESAGTSCKAILDAGDSIGSGAYMIDPDGAGGDDPFEVYCDMTTDGGGWALILKTSIASSSDFVFTSSYWTTTDTLNPSDLTIAIGSAKYQAFNTLPFIELRGCVNTATGNCVYETFADAFDSALALFGGDRIATATNCYQDFAAIGLEAPNPSCATGRPDRGFVFPSRYMWGASMGGAQASGGDCCAGWGQDWSSCDHACGWYDENTGCGAKNSWMWVR